MREIESNDLAHLRTITSTKEGEEVPTSVQEMYWKFKRLWDRGNSRPIPVETLVVLVILAGEVKNLPEDEHIEYIPELVWKGEFHHGQRVETVWRKKTVQGTYVRLGKNNKVVCTIDGDNGEEREFVAESVRPLGVVVKG